MQRFFAGFISFLFLFPALALAQVSGDVASIGYQNIYRPDAWTPMVVRLNTTSDQAAEYIIQVRQLDLDQDVALYQRLVPVTGSPGKAQLFRVYFKPQPNGSAGLPDAADPSMRLSDLQAELRVSVLSKNGTFIADLPIKDSIQSVDGPGRQGKGQRFALVVIGGGSSIPKAEYENDALRGTLEGVNMVVITPAMLPENVIGLEGVDDIIWAGADPAALRDGGDEKFQALQAWVRQGGRFTVVQTQEWQKTIGLADLLPVRLEGVRPKDDVEPLKTLSLTNRRRRQINNGSVPDPWGRVRGPFYLGLGVPKDGATTVTNAIWEEEGQRTPYLVRMPYGLGKLTWVAQDLTDPALRSQTIGWATVWDNILDLKNDSFLEANKKSDEDSFAYMTGNVVDYGDSVRESIEHSARSTALVGIAIVFFIVYWILAGPASYFLLAARKRGELNWFVFAGFALVATLFTLGIVRLVLRGSPELKHLTLVRFIPGEPALVHSRLGLYIPRDGYQNLKLPAPAPNTVPSFTGLAVPPQYPKGSGTTRGQEYVVNYRDASTSAGATALAPQLSAPFRTTLKKFQVDWTGSIDKSISGSASLVRDGTIVGIITNNTGRALKGVYIAFRNQTQRESAIPADDWILYAPTWQPGERIDLARFFQRDEVTGKQIVPQFFPPESNPSAEGFWKATVRNGWAPYWFEGKRSLTGDQKISDLYNSVPVLSYFDLCPVMANNLAANVRGRIELLRSGVRRFDLSQAVSAGGLAVVATDMNSDLPYELTVDGSVVNGPGPTIYQAVLPLKQRPPDPEDEAPTTKPSTRPTTKPTEAVGSNWTDHKDQPQG